jgi:ribonuclease G
MAKNILVISCDIAETRVALIENGIIAELHIERHGAQPLGGTVGDIYLGKVTRVLPGLQAAFIDIGLERAAFLHVEDLIRPDDFETYLAGGRKHALGAGGTSEGGQEAPTETEADESEAGPPPPPSMASVEAAEAAPALDDDHDAGKRGDIEGGEDEGDDADDGPSSARDADDADSGGAIVAGREADTDVDADAAPDVDREDDARNANDDDEREGMDDAEGSGEGPSAGQSGTMRTASSERGGRDRDEDARHEDVDGDDADDEDEGSEGGLRPSQGKTAVGLPVEDMPTANMLEDPASEPAPRGPAPIDDLLDNPNLPGFTISDPGAPAPRAPAPRLDDRDRGGGGRGRGRRRGRDRDRGRGGRDQQQEAGRGNRRDTRGGRDNREGRDGRPRSSGMPGRLSKTTPIREVVKEGQEIIVQVTKEPISTKGARCSSHISLPGRYVVYLPTLEHVGVSKRIGNDKERARLRETIDAMKPPTGGLIVRTVAEGLTKKQLKQDVGYLVRLWGEVAKKREGARAPENLLSELDIVLKTARDLLTDDVDQLVIDDKAQYDRLCRFVEMFMPERLKDIVLFEEDEPIFDAYGIEDEIARALSRKVPLPSGGYLIIDEAEALTAIDVNTGRFVGKGSKDMEETILKTNLEAVREIAYQLRFRNIGGLIILDLIDMEKAANREKVRKSLEELLQRDKAKTTLNRISDLGLIEMTRKRTRESLGRLLHEPCFYCDGTGHLQSKETIAYEILREIRRKRNDLPGYTVLVNCHPAVADLLTGSEKKVTQEAEARYMRRITVNARTEYHLEQFDLTGR